MRRYFVALKDGASINSVETTAKVCVIEEVIPGNYDADYVFKGEGGKVVLRVPRSQVHYMTSSEVPVTE